MRVLLVRHGDAIDPALASSDGLRHLTAEGRAVTHAVGAKLVERGLVPARIYTSPLVRAVQTAEILAAATGYAGGEIVVHEPLVPGGTTAHALSVLDENDDADLIALVTHEPTVRALAGHLSKLGGSFPGFRPSGVAVIDRGVGLVARLDPSTMSWRAPNDLAP